VYDVTMKITGVADTDVQVAQLITKLNRSPLFKDVNLLISDHFERSGQTLRKFQIELGLVPDADVSNVKLALQTEAVELKDARKPAKRTTGSMPSASTGAMTEDN
jgi:hypothetical protein